MKKIIRSEERIKIIRNKRKGRRNKTKIMKGIKRITANKQKKNTLFMDRLHLVRNAWRSRGAGYKRKGESGDGSDLLHCSSVNLTKIALRVR